VSPDDKVYPVIKLATVIEALAGEEFRRRTRSQAWVFLEKQCFRPQRGFRSIR
jgi:hypothetical protein